jgi:hypothetical protein
MNKHDKFWIVVAMIALSAWAYTSDEDYNEAQRAHDAYCDRVESGVHTDYEEKCDG